MFEIKHYITSDGCDVFMDWRGQVKDSKVRIAIDRRINRVELGNFGDHKFCRDEVWELRLDLGPGYRIYYARAEKSIVLLLCGGTKRSQNADIAKACASWQDWQRRRDEEQENGQ